MVFTTVGFALVDAWGRRSGVIEEYKGEELGGEMGYWGVGLGDGGVLAGWTSYYEGVNAGE